jgi:hypothetical protein
LSDVPHIEFVRLRVAVLGVRRSCSGNRPRPRRRLHVLTDVLEDAVLIVLKIECGRLDRNAV